ncbi:hypothetical protein EKH79_00410 [Dyella dinghuensis]|uniref:Uncharacterized protein n=1 Tax=Dyella dinghuensis TaxID=1920169 RepID=A0A3S0RGR0_9GAMM|nr:hypothetical protein [Dyella dinghuensis]RUL67103.1 hypothetical protein EKH79_00410 [Dyella dinghuensis]
METSNTYLKILFLTFIIVASVTICVDAQDAIQVKRDAAAGSSDTLDIAQLHAEKEIWRGFLKLALQANGTVTVRDFESAFGKRPLYHGGKGRFSYYSIENFATLNPDIQDAQATHHEQQSSFITVDLSHSLNRAACISSDTALNDLRSAGWILRNHFPKGPEVMDVREVMPPDAPYGTYTLTKGDRGSLTLGYSLRTNCAGKVTMESSKTAFDQAKGDGGN